MCLDAALVLLPSRGPDPVFSALCGLAAVGGGSWRAPLVLALRGGAGVEGLRRAFATGIAVPRNDGSGGRGKGGREVTAVQVLLEVSRSFASEDGGTRETALIALIDAMGRTAGDGGGREWSASIGTHVAACSGVDTLVDLCTATSPGERDGRPLSIGTGFRAAALLDRFLLRSGGSLALTAGHLCKMNKQ